jgi:DNA-binding LytR/AlgR family response regulator
MENPKEDSETYLVSCPFQTAETIQLKREIKLFLTSRPYFIRTHHSFLVNMNFVDKIIGNFELELFWE